MATWLEIFFKEAKKLLCVCLILLEESLTVTLQDADLLLEDLTEIVVVPTATAVTLPLLTVATFELEEDQVKDVFALLGIIVAVKLDTLVPFKSRDKLYLFKEIEATSPTGVVGTDVGEDDGEVDGTSSGLSGRSSIEKIVSE